MPGIFSHFAILDNILKRPALSSKAKSIIEAHREHAFWGSVGPDYLFFFPPDWPQLELLLQTYYKYDNLTDEINNVMESAGNILGSKDSDIKDMITGGVWTDFRTSIEAVLYNVTSRILELATSKVDFYMVVKPPMKDQPYNAFHRQNDWWWMDIAHHVRTSRFTRELWENSRNDESLRAYTYGYISHVGSDVIGHPYVNLLVGGPYRNHWRRHGLVEKCIDTYIWDYHFGSELASSEAYKWIYFEKPGFTIEELPQNLCNFISGCLSNTYYDMNFKNGVPTTDDIQLMYRYMYKFIKSASSKSLVNFPPPKDFDWWDLPEKVREKLDVIRNPPNKGKFPGFNPKNFSFRKWKVFLKSMFDYIGWLADTIKIIITLPIYIWARVTTTEFRYMLWLLIQQLYSLYSVSRLAMAAGAYVHPTRDQVYRHFSHLFSPDPAWHKDYPCDFDYPQAALDYQTYHLVHPSTFNLKKESTPTEPFFRQGGSIIQPEDALLSQIKSGTLSGFEKSRTYAPDEALLKSLADSDRLLSATDFSLHLFELYEQEKYGDLPDWNLDGDRGLGWPEWLTEGAFPWRAHNYFYF
ncbi:MAG: zinc dependent phospholipase C family protein [Chitinophagaceae bacterium]|nr:zinc dependent phospholipase C family protein [Chitinophagaceae bacterium]